MCFTGDKLGIYVHIPFCKGKCPYCSFYSVCPQNTDDYTKAVCRSLKYWSQINQKPVDTIYFGGGTPSVLPSENICEILNCISENYELILPEITLEVNPADYSYTDFEMLRKCGVNRVSLGVQSAIDSELKNLGRRHNFGDVFNALHTIKSVGIYNISCDIMLATPDQNLNSLNKFAQFCVEQDVKHVSAYLLKIEPGTLFYKNKKSLNLPTEDESVELYNHFCGLMAQNGYNHYEISNFAKPDFESKHNLKYWNLDEYLGIGPSAHSLFGGKRFYYPDDISKFLHCPATLPEGEFEPEKEYIMLRLRLSGGVNNELFKAKFGRNIPQIYLDKAKKFEKHGLMKTDKSNGFSLTEQGFLLSNSIICEIL